MPLVSSSSTFHIHFSIITFIVISQLIRYARECSAYHQLLNRGKLLTINVVGVSSVMFGIRVLQLFGHYNDRYFKKTQPFVRSNAVFFSYHL